ncbi:LCP family protein [Kitasatospora sp. NPDC088391]|uniref:LCP family protein n=1 Tax=Kitasatospora sp. NPDC088391 TaxID=3364074 RepID=UPI00381A2C7E
MDDGDGEFEVRLGKAFGQAGSGPDPELTARLVDGGLATGRRLRRARRRRSVLLAGALTAAVLAGAGVLTVPHGLPGGTSAALEAAHASDAPAPVDRGVTVLLIGLDSAVDAQGRPAPDQKLPVGRSNGDPDTADTLLLVHVSADGGEVRQLSVPRDVLVPADGGGQVAIGQVYADAERAATDRLRGSGVSGPELRVRGREAGRQALLGAVERFGGLRVDHFAEVSMAGFYRVAEALGGVPVCLNRPVDDRFSGAHLPAGPQRLGPAQALAFVRQRHGVGTGADVERTRRAQAFMSGVLAELRAGGALTDARKLSALYGAIGADLVVDRGWSPVDFVRQVPAFAVGRGTVATLPVVVDGTRLRAEPGAVRELLTGDATGGATGPAAPSVAASPSSASSASSADAAAAAAAAAAASAAAAADPDGVPCVD